MSDGPDKPEDPVQVDNPTKTALEDRKLTDEEVLIEEGKVMAMLAYVFWPIPYMSARENAFVVFHLRQGALILVALVGVVILKLIGIPLHGFLSAGMTCLTGIISVGILIFMVLGLVNASKGFKEKLPIIGDLGDKVPI